ncbi:MAG: glycosyltransferase [Planctomycetota bacterium JB042]
MSACLIVRDEESCLGRCLASIEPWVDEICVVDTGSSDRTVEIARRFGAKVRRAAWEDDFSAARNASLELATRRWILVIDADEELTEEGGRALRRAIEEPRRQSWLVRLDSLLGEDDDDEDVRTVAVPRLFRNRPEIRFRRRVHESVMESVLALEATPPEPSGVRILHHGYRPETVARRDKRARNLALLRRCHAEDERDLFVLFKLASGVDGDERRTLLEAAVREARRLPERERRSYPFLPLVFERLARERIETGALAEAKALVAEAIDTFGPIPELRFRLGDLARRSGDAREARRWLASCVGARRGGGLRVDDPSARGVRPMLGLVGLAVDSGRLDEARTLVEHALSVDPSDLLARRFEVELKLLDPGTQPEGLAALSWLVDEAPFSPDVGVVAGRFAWTGGDPDTAERLWHRAAERTGDAALEAVGLLVLVRLARGDHGAAAALLDGGRWVPRDVGSAAAGLLAAVVLARPFRLDPEFVAESVLRRLVTLLSELLSAGDGSAAARFAENAPAYEATLPGIGSLLVDDGT